jgi:TolA-binding protein
MDLPDLQEQIDTINANLDEMSSSLQDISDNIDQNLSDQETTDGDFEQRMSTLEDSSGQLLFPLTQDTIDLITEQSPAILSNYYGQGYAGYTTLVAGTKTIKNSFITANSLIFLTVSTTGGIQGFLSYVASAGQVVINSSNVADTSTVNFIIINPK